MQHPVDTPQLPQAVIDLLIEICARELVAEVFDAAPTENEPSQPNSVHSME